MPLAGALDTGGLYFLLSSIYVPVSQLDTHFKLLTVSHFPWQGGPEALRLVKEIRPRAVMLENVRGLASPKFAEYRAKILSELEGLGYRAGSKNGAKPKYFELFGKRLGNRADNGVTEMGDAYETDVLDVTAVAVEWTPTSLGERQATAVEPTPTGWEQRCGASEEAL